MPSGKVVSSESDTDRVDRDRSDGEMNVEPVDAERGPFSPIVARRWARVPGSKAFDAPLHCRPRRRRIIHRLVECWLAPSWRRSGSSEYLRRTRPVSRARLDPRHPADVTSTSDAESGPLHRVDEVAEQRAPLRRPRAALDGDVFKSLREELVPCVEINILRRVHRRDACSMA